MCPLLCPQVLHSSRAAARLRNTWSSFPLICTHSAWGWRVLGKQVWLHGPFQDAQFKKINWHLKKIFCLSFRIMCLGILPRLSNIIWILFAYWSHQNWHLIIIIIIIAHTSTKLALLKIYIFPPYCDCHVILDYNPRSHQ